MADNLLIWNALGKTDPAHTKSFNRAGGFKGTAIKPVYTDQKMTEQFGPCGTGWGYSEPTFQVVPASDGQIAVYCWLSLWYVLDGKRSEPVHGVGGDFVVVKQSSGLRSDDEAFKKAFTDAIGNAMKHLGMSADVHMGRFDDAKYVRDLREEKAAEAHDPETGELQPPIEKQVADDLIRRIKGCRTEIDLAAIKKDENFRAALKDLPQPQLDRVYKAGEVRKAELQAGADNLVAG